MNNKKTFTTWPSWHNHTGAGLKFSYCADQTVSYANYLNELARPGTCYSAFAITEHAYSMVSADIHESWPGAWFDNPSILEKNHGFIVEKMTAFREEGKIYRNGSTVFQGLEVEIDSRGMMAVPEDMVWDLDVVIGSVHHNPGPAEAWVERHFTRINALAKQPFDIIGHPVRHLKDHSSPENPLPQFIISETLDILKKNGLALEINSHVMQIQDDSRLLCGAVERGIPVAFSLDMHRPDEFERCAYFESVVNASGVLPTDIVLFKPNSGRHSGRNY